MIETTMDWYNNYEPILLIAILLSLAINGLMILTKKSDFAISKMVALIGMPRSGKTTLITSIFSNIFNDNGHNYNIFVKGDETINKVNEDIHKLEIGKELSPTTDQDIFAYRADLYKNYFLLQNFLRNTSLFTRHYKLEIADFPGEQTEAISNKSTWFKELPYFKWVMESDILLFIVDLEQFVEDRETYASEITSSFRTILQSIKDKKRNNNLNSFKRIPKILVFTKNDLLVQNNISTVDLEDLYFKDLINYLEHETINLEIHYTGIYDQNHNYTRKDTSKVLKSILKSI